MSPTPAHIERRYNLKLPQSGPVARGMQSIANVEWGDAIELISFRFCLHTACVRQGNRGKFAPYSGFPQGATCAETTRMY